MTKTLLFTSAAAAAALMATSATAQVAGGLGGQVGGQVGVPQIPPVTGAVGETVRDGRDMTRETVRDGRRATRDVRPQVDADVNASARSDARADGQGAEADLDVSVGGSVRSSDGAELGSVVDVARDAAGRATGFLVRSADGAVRMVPTDGASIEGQAVVTTWTESQFRAQRPR